MKKTIFASLTILTFSALMFCCSNAPKQEKASSTSLICWADTSGLKPKVITGNADKGIHLSIASDIRNPEGYRLLVSENGIEIAGASNAGIFYGVQTLRKSIPAVAEGMDIELPAASINDYPRFPYRVMHLDVSRHFFPVDSVKKFIDILALHNMALSITYL